MVCFVIAVSITGGFYGFYPARKDSPDIFGPYKQWGEKRIPVAAWEICAVLLGFYLMIKYGTAGVALMMNSTIAAVLGGILFVIGFFVFLFKTIPGKVAREYIKATKRKVCPLVVIEPSEKK